MKRQDPTEEGDVDVHAGAHSQFNSESEETRPTEDG
jgi:hypothetical protein